MKRPGRKPLYPWLEMEVGETRFIPSDTPKKVRSAAGHQPSRCGRSFKTKRTLRKGRLGILVTRTA